MKIDKTTIIVISILILPFAYIFLSSQKGENSQAPSTAKPVVKENTDPAFYGEKGKELKLNGESILLSTAEIPESKVQYFNTKLDGKTIYFMVVKDSTGIYRAAANACEVCFGSHKGFYQDGDEIVCNNCRNRFPLSNLGVVKGGCNPGPISSNLKVENNNLVINKTDLLQVKSLF